MADLAHLDPTALLGAGAALITAGFLRGFTGFGFGLAATPLLSMILPPVQVVPIVLLMQAGSSLVHWRRTIATCDRRSTWRLSLAALVGTPAGTALLVLLPPALARGAIAVVLLAAVAILLPRRSPGATEPPARDWTIVPAGLLAGVLSGFCAMPGPPVIAWYMHRRVPAPVARASMTVIFFATGCLALVAVAPIDRGVLVAALVAAPLVVGGTMAGTIAFHHAPASAYRPIGLIALIAIAAGATWRAIA
jgi:uncharacterized protein